ncbi:MAG: DUF58 domain-containing protein [Gammaproteobacteria bacterium]|nr:DUF58 domain-containing protein [Gammaproteobacteria bacterium]
MKVPRPIADWIERGTAKRAVGGNWPSRLNRSQVFILPSRFGLLAGAASIVMLLVALNYQNSAVFLLAFLLGALLLVAMVSCHQHLNGLEILHVHADRVFAGEPIRLQVDVRNPSRRARSGLACHGSGAIGPAVRVAVEGGARLELALPPRRRGRHPIRRLSLDSREPFGVFRAWSRLAPVHCIVYPRPAMNALPPPGHAGLATRGIAPHQPEDFLGLARYRPGDRPGQIEWRHYARGGTLERKHFGGAGGGAAWLDFVDAPGTDAEARLSVLCAWVLQAERETVHWGLRLPGYLLAPGRGSQQLERGLTALALYPGPYPA